MLKTADPVTPRKAAAPAAPQRRRIGSRRSVAVGGGALLLIATLSVLSQYLLQDGSLSGVQRLDMCLTGGARTQRPSIFLFIGIISARNNWDRRQAVRDAWGDASQVTSKSATRFFVPSDGPVDGSGPVELAAKQDFVWLRGDNSYRTIAAATLAVFRHVVATYDFSFVLKADDDSFVNVPALIQALMQQCRHPLCNNEGIYLGQQVEGIVVTHHQPKHPHNSDDFWRHSGLATYPKYMAGGGYVISDDVARMLIATQQTVGLKSYTVEDAAFGYWLQPWDIRHINHTRFRTIGSECCFEPGHSSTEVLPEISKDLCSAWPWLVLHKVAETEQMRILGQCVRSCATFRPAILASEASEGRSL